MKKIVVLSLFVLFAAALPASAHFQMLYTPETILDKGGDVPLKRAEIGRASCRERV